MNFVHIDKTKGEKITTMSLKLYNKTNITIWVAIAHQTQTCLDRWFKHGWYKIGPWETKTVLPGSVKNESVYYFATDQGFYRVWDGIGADGVPPLPATLPDNLGEFFTRCLNEPYGTLRQMRHFRPTLDTETLNFTLR